MALIKSISGIRGTIGGFPGQALTPVDIVKFSAAFGVWTKNQTEAQKCQIVVGRDARISGPLVSDLVIATLNSMGIDVIDAGLATTPTVEIAVESLKAHSGIIITASHNPFNWNALKLLNHKGEFISAQDGREVLEIAEREDFSFSEVQKLGAKQSDDFLERHIQAILDLELVDPAAIKERNFRVAIDTINSVGGIAVPALLKALGVTRFEHFNEKPDGHFSHNPEPVPENITQICNEIEHSQFDLGLVVDPDVDRLVIIREDGTPFGEEYTLVAVADYILQHNPGPTVSNLSSSRALKDVTEKYGCEYHAAAVGEVNVVEQMKAVGAVIGGEGNGGVIYPELHYGRDALVGIALFLTYLAKFGKSVSALRAKYPNYHISKNKIEMPVEVDVDFILNEVTTKYQSQPINTVDGVKIDFEKGWLHLRKSNTEPIIRIISESDTQATADHLANKVMMDIKEIITSKV